MKYCTILLLTILASCSIGQNPDINLLKQINLNRDKSLDGTFKFITQSDPDLIISVPLGYLATGWILRDSTITHNGMYLLGTFIFNGILTTGIKDIIKRPRPFETYTFIDKVVGAGGYSMPSGHTSSAFALATSLSIVHPRWYVIAPSFIWAGAVGYSRLHLGVHYPGDVLAGAALGAGSALLCNYINKKIFAHNKH